ncbi:hypothetical protein PS627_03902 [Pseudomonas fluorescens]|uniref:hypothetical protein n=1 Tax=Pseudomonas fluorescens TaxID=294 RepID=UPI0012567FD8|nr:hypothetical protein [Pseudomonas fluorescens]CAG8870193.1 hypothetical protein PS627_03902 [Pseudomonas fluorescens]VVP80207.1 hypothetical protein PS910_01882 [Pseudomonas fluorescens]
MHPEHHDFSNPVFLPITEESSQGLLGADGASGLGSLSDAELASVMVIQHLAQAGEKSITAGGAEKILAKLIGWAIDTPYPGLLSETQRLFDQRKLYFGLDILKTLNLRLLDADEVAARDYLLPDGKWDLAYKVRHHARHDPFTKQMETPVRKERWLSSAQDKLVRTFRANLDEDLHVQGYAGVGKSHLLGTLMECLPPGRTLPLARTAGKLAALRKRLGVPADKPLGMTFQAFALALLKGPRGGSIPRGEKTSGRLPTKAALAEELAIFGFRGYSAEQTLDICLAVVTRFCESWDQSLALRHLPFFQLPLSNVENRVLLEYASRVWTWLEAHPQWASRTGFEALLDVKRASLAGCVVPSRFTHVIVDESQDIPASLLQIIERGRQVLITMGDEYQKASGPVVRRKRQVRQSDVSYSVRSGRKVEALVNPLISLHSEKSKVPFEGARDADVSIETYPERFTPPEGCVVLTASRWDTMRWALELSRANCGFSFFDKAAEQDMKRFMTSAIKLFRPQFYGVEGHDELHASFAEVADWGQVQDASQFDQSFTWIQSELERGFNMADLTALDRMITSNAAGCLLMVAEDAGGWEFDQVLLTPELLTTIRFKDAYAFDQRICAIYIAISRARKKLFLPYELNEWIDYHKGMFRESHGY